MFILIFGKDTYQSWQKLKQLLESYQKKARMVLFLDPFINQKFSFQDFKNELQHVSMFQEKKLIALRNVLSNAEFKNQFLAHGKGFADSDNVVIFYEERDLPSNDILISFFKTNGKIFQHNPLSQSELKNWIKQEITKLGAKIDPLAVSALINFIGNNLWRMSTEIAKIATYKGKGKIILKEDVESLVRPMIETAIFKTIDAIASKDKKTALSLIYKHLEKGESPLYILSMINFQFRNLLLVKELGDTPITAAVAALRPMHPFVVQKSFWQAKRFGIEQLKEIYLKIFKIDLAVKTGKIKPELALELLIADI